MLPAVRSELVQLDVVVNGRDGKPMADLAAGDFQVLEDGKVQALSHFAVSRRSAVGRTAESVATTNEMAPAEPSLPGAPTTEARLFVLAVDDLHTAPGSMASARRAMHRFVDEQASPEDYVALVTTSGRLGVHQDFTRDRDALHRAIERVSSQYQPVQPGGAPYLSEHQAELIDRNDVEALRLAVREVLQTEDYLGEVGAREKAFAQARRMVFEIMARSGRTLGTVEAVVRGLAPLPGRKTIILLSDGFLIGLGAAENRAFDVRRIVDAATRSGVVLYALDTRGVVADVPGGEASFQGPGVLTAPGVRESLQARGREAQRQSLNALAEDTGGFLVRESNDVSGGFGRILGDSEIYYHLAYVPSNAARDGRFRRIVVRVPRRPGVRVRTRSGYFASDDRKAAQTQETGDPRTQRERELGSALASPFPLGGVPMQMSADFIDLPPAGAQAVIRALVDVSGVPFTPTRDRFEADLEIVGAVYDEAGQSVGDVSGERAELSLTETNYRRVMAEGLSIQKTVALRPGRYQVRMAVREGTLSLLGSASQWLEVPDTSDRAITLSSVFLLADGGAGSSDLTDVQVEKRFRSGQGLHYVVHVYGQSPAGAVLQAQVWQGNRLVGVTPKHDLASLRAGASPAPASDVPGDVPADAPAQDRSGIAPTTVAAKWSERIALQGFAPGAYELRLLVNGRSGVLVAQRRVLFRVE
jgi:VWFA-related protein